MAAVSKLKPSSNVLGRIRIGRGIFFHDITVTAHDKMRALVVFASSKHTPKKKTHPTIQQCDTIRMIAIHAKLVGFETHAADRPLPAHQHDIY